MWVRIPPGLPKLLEGIMIDLKFTYEELELIYNWFYSHRKRNYVSQEEVDLIVKLIHAERSLFVDEK
jgi:hypothetical protein